MIDTTSSKLAIKYSKMKHKISYFNKMFIVYTTVIFFSTSIKLN